MSQSSPHDFFAVIPAGGSGSRLWPLSRTDTPKFLHDLSGNGHSLLRNTIDRLKGVTTGDGIFVVTGAGHHNAVKLVASELSPSRILIEPSGKDSAAAIALGALSIQLENPDAIMGSFAADHVIGREDLFHAVIRQAIDTAAQGKVVTVGVRPTEPSSAFGYIETDARSGSTNVRSVVRFVEKPSYEDARSYLQAGSFFWNAGMFIAKVSVVIDSLKEHAPELLRGIQGFIEARNLGDYELAARRWDSLPRVAIDYVLAEPVAAKGQMSMIVADFGWDDVGDFAALAKVRKAESQEGLTVLGSNAKVVAIDATGVVVSQTRRLVSLVGVSDIVVVDTPDALLVTSKNHAQDVKKMVEHMKLEGLDDLL